MITTLLSRPKSDGAARATARGANTAKIVARVAIVVALVLLALFPLMSDSIYYQNMLINTFLLAIGATTWNIMGGYAGYISLGNSAFVGLGSYATGILATRSGISPFIGCFIGGVVCAVYAAVLSVVTSRTRGMFFTIVTFAALQLLGITATVWSSLTGGSHGLSFPLPTWDLKYQNWPFYYPLLVLLVVSVVASGYIRRSKLGLGLFAIRDDEDKAAGLGISTETYKLIAFVVGGTILGVAGGIYGYYTTFLNTSAVFDIVTSMLIVLAALLGGRGTLWGPVLGAFIIEPLSNFTSTNLGGADAGSIRLIIFGGLLGAVVLFLPRGIVATLSGRFQRARLHPATPEQQPKAEQATGEGDRLLGGADALQVREVSKAFGALKAVDEATLRIPAGSVTGLMGPNGSGKTTLFNLIDGTVPTRRGTIEVSGRRIERRGRAARAHAGLARTYQLPRLFGSLTVVENIVAPQDRFAWGGVFRPRVNAEERVRAVAALERLGLAQFADVSPADLSYGQRKLIELAQVLWLDPVLVMLDEPAAGISPALESRLTAMIEDLHRRGVAVLLVEHDLAFLSGVCSHVYVMANGRIIADASVEAVKSDPVVIEAYLGSSVEVTAAAHGHESTEFAQSGEEESKA